MRGLCHWVAPMKTIRNACFFVALFGLAITLAASAQDGIAQRPTSPPPFQMVAPVQMTPEGVQAIVLQWFGVCSVLITGLAGLVAHALAKFQEVKERQNRQSEKTGQLQNQVVGLASQLPPQQAPQSGQNAAGAGLVALLCCAITLSGCASSGSKTTGQRSPWAAIARIGTSTLKALAKIGSNIVVAKASAYEAQEQPAPKGFSK